MHRKDIPKRSDIKEVEFTLDTKETLFKNQEKKCNGCFVVFDKRNLEQGHYQSIFLLRSFCILISY